MSSRHERVLGGIIGIALFGALGIAACDPNDGGLPIVKPVNPLRLVASQGQWTPNFYRDIETGCEYFGTIKGGVIARMDKTGKQICRDVKKEGPKDPSFTTEVE